MSISAFINLSSKTSLCSDTKVYVNLSNLFLLLFFILSFNSIHMRIALFPGTFDPITLGHTDIINRALPLFDKLIIGVGINTNKQPMFSLEQRMDWIRQIYIHHPKVEVQSYRGLTVNFCTDINAHFILRGIRNVGDYEFEKSIADMNRSLNPLVETVFLTCSPMYTSYSSTIVRDVITNQGDYSKFLPVEINLT